MKLNQCAIFLLPTALFVSGCTTINPDKLQTPLQVTCIELTEPLSHTTKIDVTIRLEKGAYWSEKMDDQGVYYRGPAGGISVVKADGRPGWIGQPLTMDGGFYIPKNPGDPVKLYKYFSMEPAPVQTSADEGGCAALAYVRDPATSKISVGAFMAAGATSGAIAGLTARGMADGGKMSYGQAAGVGLAGGLIAGAIISTALSAEIGKIDNVMPPLHALPNHEAFLNKLRTLSGNAVVVKEVKTEAVGAAERTTAPAAYQ